MAILVLTIATAFALAACSPVLRAHGYTPSEEDLAVIEVGVATEDNVAAAVGTPAFVSGTGAKGWYYLSSTVQSYAYEHPEVTNRRLVAISFDENGTVTNIERFGLEDGRVIALNRPGHGRCRRIARVDSSVARQHWLDYGRRPF